MSFLATELLLLGKERALCQSSAAEWAARSSENAIHHPPLYMID